MAQVVCKSMIPNDKPQWLLNVQDAVLSATAHMNLSGSAYDFKNLKLLIDASIEAQRSRGNLFSKVTTNMITDSGRVVINIFRGGIHIQSYYIEYYE